MLAFLQLYFILRKEVAMTDSTEEIHPVVIKWIKLHPAAATVYEAKNYFTTSEILGSCNDIFFDEALTEAQLYSFLTQSGYELIDVNGTNRWITK